MHMRAALRRLSIILCLNVACWGLGPTDTQASGARLPMVLELADGQFVRGRLLEITDSLLRWDGEYFTQPLEFPLAAVRGISFPPSPNPVTPPGEFVMELNNRDLVFGDLVAIDDQGVKFTAPHINGLTLHTAAVRRIARRDRATQVHAVPTRLGEWKTSEASHWQGEGGGIKTDQAGAWAFADVGLHQATALELELAWTGVPNFACYLGTDMSPESQKNAFSFEVWGDQVVAQRHVELADLASLRPVESGSLHVHVYLHQAAGKLIVYDTSGKLLAELHVPAPDAGRPSGFKLLNRRGNVWLKHLRVRGWSGTKPGDGTGEGIFLLAGDENHEGDTIRLQAGKVTLLRAGQATHRLGLDDLRLVDFPSSPYDGQPTLIAAGLDSSRVTGKLVSSDGEKLVVQSSISENPLTLDISVLRAIRLNPLLGASQEHRVPPAGHRRGTLEMMDTRLLGWLVEQQPSGEDASCLVWRPALAHNASTLRNDVQGRIAYREVIQVSKKPAQQRQARRRAGQAMIIRQFIGGFGKPRRPKQIVSREPALHLRSGDVIPCQVTGIDEQGIHIESSLSETDLIPHAHVKAAQLAHKTALPRLNEAKLRRLLTLPRMQRNAPPLHLLFSPEGDVMRGSVSGLNADEVLLDVRLDTHPIPLDRVAAIVWLHEDEWSDSSPERPAEGPPEEMSQSDEDARLEVQVVTSADSRYTFRAESFSEQTIHGTSLVLHDVRASVKDADHLFLGEFIHRAARSLPYHRWRLSPAQDPKFVLAQGEASSAAPALGTESHLVGRPAPEIRLKMLEGGGYLNLSDHRGHCVVLDFWATWCGPCLQSMPEVARIAAEFSDRDVLLFAVNLEERPEIIQSVLQRRGLDVPVALDRDGVAAIRYEATAIPQTVVIGPEGNIERVFVGSSERITEGLRAALAELTATDGEIDVAEEASPL